VNVLEKYKEIFYKCIEREKEKRKREIIEKIIKLENKLFKIVEKLKEENISKYQSFSQK